ncbi:MAG TPA: transposase [Ktedonobacteraceae bacterium]|nr:transposase [Ktedonobacteraceae bacterium]
MGMKAYKFRLSPNKTTSEHLQWILDRCRELYNAALAERKEAYRMAGLSISYYEQKRALPDIKELRPEYKDIGSHVLQDVVLRVENAYKAFFRRVKADETPGHPRFKGKNWYDSFCYPDGAGWKLSEDRLTLTKIGTIKVKMHREIEGKVKTCTIKREGAHWYVTFACEVEEQALPISYEDVGIDLGVTHFAALSNGEIIDHPRYFRKAEKKLAKLQQALAKKKRGSHRRKKVVQQVAKAHRKVHNQRRDFAHKASRQLVNRYQVIVFEDLKTANMVKRPKAKQDEATGQYLPNGASAKAGLNKSITDAGWNMFTEMVSAKAASVGRTILFVNPYKTSQICSGCGCEVKKDLSVRWHSCACGTELDRDVNAAVNILALGKKVLGGMRPTSETA